MKIRTFTKSNGTEEYITEVNTRKEKKIESNRCYSLLLYSGKILCNVKLQKY